MPPTRLAQFIAASYVVSMHYSRVIAVLPSAEGIGRVGYADNKALKRFVLKRAEYRGVCYQSDAKMHDFDMD